MKETGGNRKQEETGKKEAEGGKKEAGGRKRRNRQYLWQGNRRVLVCEQD